MSETVLLEIVDDEYAILTINRPNKRNAISKEVVLHMDKIVTQLHHEQHIKFIVVTGNGSQAFCAGGDLNDFHGEMSEEEAYELLKPMRDVLFKMATLPIPTICWMNGLARGGGMEIASACDFRFANENSTYGFVQGELGISTGWGGGTLLYHRIHSQQAFYWFVKSEVQTAEQLKDAGFIQDYIDTIDPRKSNIILTFKNRSVEQMKLWKKQWLKSISIEQLNEMMNDEVLACSKLWETDEHKQAVLQFFSKNKK